MCRANTCKVYNFTSVPVSTVFSLYIYAVDVLHLEKHKMQEIKNLNIATEKNRPRGKSCISLLNITKGLYEIDFADE